MVTTRTFSASQLETVLPGMILPHPVARAVKVLVQLGKLEGRTVTPAGPYGAGLRDMACQWVFYRASHGSVADARIAHIDPTMKTNVAYPGSSSHGDGTRADFLFNGHNADADDVAFMARNKWAHEFGTNDANHFRFTGDMSGTVPAAAINRILGAWLNGKHLGRQTRADFTGVEDANLVWLIQHEGHLEKVYPRTCNEDGITGHFTGIAKRTLFERLL